MNFFASHQIHDAGLGGVLQPVTFAVACLGRKQFLRRRISCQHTAVCLFLSFFESRSHQHRIVIPENKQQERLHQLSFDERSCHKCPAICSHGFRCEEVAMVIRQTSEGQIREEAVCRAMRTEEEVLVASPLV